MWGESNEFRHRLLQGSMRDTKLLGLQNGLFLISSSHFSGDFFFPLPQSPSWPSFFLTESSFRRHT